MVVLLQRVSRASVSIDGTEAGSIGEGLLLFVGIEQGDTETESSWLARKCTQLRVFADDEGYMNHSLIDVGGEALVVSQFTLCGDTNTGNRPSFTRAAPPDKARELYNHFIEELQSHLSTQVQSGEFGAMMDVELLNDGPVTFWVERSEQ